MANRMYSDDSNLANWDDLDHIGVLDVSDATDGAGGTSKYTTYAQLKTMLDSRYASIAGETFTDAVTINCNSATALLVEQDGVNDNTLLVDTATPKVTVSAQFDIVQNSDTVSISHDGTDAYFQTTDGAFIFSTNEGTNTDTIIAAKGKGTGLGYVRVYDEDDSEYVQIHASAGTGYIKVIGASPGDLVLQSNANGNVTMFPASTEGETKQLFIYGYKTGDSLRSLQIGVGVDYANTASFDGVDYYYFDGYIGTTGNITVGGVQVSAHYDFGAINTGVFMCVETTTPTADADHGKFYCKSDNKAYFQDGAGTEHELAFA